MKRYMPEMTNLQVREYLEGGGRTVLDPVFLSTPGSFWALLEEGGGVWGNPSESTVEKGEQFLQWGAASVVSLVRDMETMHDRIAPGYDRFRQPRA